MESILKDIRFAARSLLKRPGFTVIVVLTLALGIGANAAVFSVINAVLLRPLPYRDAERVVTIWQNNVKAGIPNNDVSPANFIDWSEARDSGSKSESNFCDESRSTRGVTQRVTQITRKKG